MYRHCIYCSADLGANESVEAFPVGRTLAFDASKGRLWAVCGRCARWNLAPIEERWEVIEDAERIFRDTRLRVQSENVGLARLPDGTRLIRVGQALEGELAAWRYGDQLVKRRRRYFLTGAAAIGGGLLLYAGVTFVATGVGLGMANAVGTHAWRWYRRRRPIYTLPAQDTPNGAPLELRRKHLANAVLWRGSGGIELQIPGALYLPSPKWKGLLVETPLVLPDPVARRVLERGLVQVNAAGANRRTLDSALGRLSSAGSAEGYIQDTAASRAVLEGDASDRLLTPEMSLALEIALHEEQERRAMEGELSSLEAAWRDAEPIAAIADRLALDPGNPE